MSTDPFKELTGLTRKEYSKRKKRQIRERIIILHEHSKGKDEDAIAEGFNLPKEQVYKEIDDYVRFSMSRFTPKTGDEIRHSMAKYVAPFLKEGKAQPPKKQGLTRTWDSKTKRWVYKYTKRTKKAKKQPDTKLSQREKWLLAGEYKIRGKPKEARKLGKVVTKGLKVPKVPTGMTLQKSLTKTGGQMHFKNGGGKKKPKALSAKKTNKRVNRIKKGSDNLMTFGVKLPSVKTLEDMIK